jgi:hypothetical protein
VCEREREREKERERSVCVCDREREREKERESEREPQRINQPSSNISQNSSGSLPSVTTCGRAEV